MFHQNPNSRSTHFRAFCNLIYSKVTFIITVILIFIIFYLLQILFIFIFILIINFYFSGLKNLIIKGKHLNSVENPRMIVHFASSVTGESLQLISDVSYQILSIVMKFIKKPFKTVWKLDKRKFLLK